MKYVYLANMDDSDMYKIGYTSNPERRMKQLQTGNPKKINLINSFESDLSIKIESVMHRSYNHCKIDEYDGKKLIGEWFLLNKYQVDNFLIECQRINKNLLSLELNKEDESSFQSRV